MMKDMPHKIIYAGRLRWDDRGWVFPAPLKSVGKMPAQFYLKRSKTNPDLDDIQEMLRLEVLEPKNHLKVEAVITKKR